MVNFSVFNELSLPLEQYKAVDTFIQFFKLLSELKQNGFNLIRMSQDFKDYDIFKDISLQQFLGQLQDRDFKRKLMSFIVDKIVVIETPIIKKEEKKQQDELLSCEYFYNNQTTANGLASCDIWNTIAVSFSTQAQWKHSLISLKKITLTADNATQENLINIKHASNKDHLKQHPDFFEEIREEQKHNITQCDFWDNREEYFPKIIKFCPEVEGQIKKIDKTIFQQTMSILRDIETQRKLPTDYHWSVDGESVHNNPKLENQRIFTVLGEDIFFSNHIKSLSNGNRMYFLEKGNNVYIGYIGKHLKTKNY